jgi:hypothetical protein
MLAVFGVGFVVGIVIVIVLIKLTMREDPTGCLIGLGLVSLLFCWLLVLIPWLVLFE